MVSVWDGVGVGLAGFAQGEHHRLMIRVYLLSRPADQDPSILSNLNHKKSTFRDIFCAL